LASNVGKLTIGNKELGQEIIVEVEASTHPCRQVIPRAGLVQDSENILKLVPGDILIYYIGIM